MHKSFILFVLFSFLFICCEKNEGLPIEQLLTSQTWTLHSRDMDGSTLSLNECVNIDRLEIKPLGEATINYSCEFSLNTSGTWELIDDNKLTVIFLLDSMNPTSQFPIIKGTITSLTTEQLIISRSDTIRYSGTILSVINGTETWIH